MGGKLKLKEDNKEDGNTWYWNALNHDITFARVMKLMIGSANKAHRYIKLSNKVLQVKCMQMTSYRVIDRSYAINHPSAPDRNQR